MYVLEKTGTAAERDEGEAEEAGEVHLQERRQAEWVWERIWKNEQIEEEYFGQFRSEQAWRFAREVDKECCLRSCEYSDLGIVELREGRTFELARDIGEDK